MPSPIRPLSPVESRVLGSIGVLWCSPPPGSKLQTLESLERRGLIERREQPLFTARLLRDRKVDAFWPYDWRVKPRFRIHRLKTWPQHYQDIIAGKKKFELRKADRDFRVDDVLELYEWDPDLLRATGDECRVMVTHLLKDTRFGLQVDYCVMSIGNPWFDFALDLPPS